MRSTLLVAVLATVLAASVVSAMELGVGVGSVVRSPNTGHEYVLEAEVEYSPRLVAERSATAAAAEAPALLQENEHQRLRRVGRNPSDWIKGEQIGRGGFGAIFRGRRKGAPDAPAVAIKTTVIANDREAPAIRKELEVQKKLQVLCPGLVVEAHDSWESTPAIRGGRRELYIVMELMASDLHKYIPKRRAKQLGADLPSALRLWLPMIRSVQCLHHNGYVHRDLKGGNWLISEDEHTVKAADFGETRTREQIAHTGNSIMPHQTIIYNAPHAVRVHRTPENPKGSPVFKPTRSWADYIQWDGYATGLTMLEVYFAKEVDVIAESSTEPKLAHNDLMGLLEVYLKGFANAEAYAKFVGGLNKAFSATPLPAEVDTIVRGLVLEQADHGIDQVNTNAAPFTRSWIRSHDSWIGSESTAPATPTPAPHSSPSSTSSSTPATAHHGTGVF